MHTLPTTQMNFKELTKSQVDGSFFLNNHLAHSLKNTLRNYDGFAKLNPIQAEALDSLMVAVAHIVNGDKRYIGYWQNLQGIITEVIKDMKMNLDTFESNTEYRKLPDCPF